MNQYLQNQCQYNATILMWAQAKDVTHLKLIDGLDRMAVNDSEEYVLIFAVPF
jgi:hypothetical protein